MRNTISEGLFALQIFFLERYGRFDEQGNYSNTKPVPFWANQLARAIGKMATSVRGH
ncbi:hypothetical protein [Aphanothece hegewaldii]|uniref:hypothetical protein n=1 Tax=Aphanothece hegewaldii TaxID=1521625 RepID=UPI0015E67D39|nr:hypothetical protein [Aphanothece hegewaldii]